MSIMFAVGKYGGFRINRSEHYYRFVFGFFAIWFIKSDMDRILVNLSHAVKISKEFEEKDDNSAKNDTK